MKLISDRTEKIYTVQADDGKDLTEGVAQGFAENLLEMRGNRRDWFFAGCERVNYDTVKVIFVEDR